MDSYGGMPFSQPTAPGYSINSEFNLEPLDLGIDIPDREAIITEQNRICSIINQYVEAVKLAIYGCYSNSVPQLNLEGDNKEQLRQLVRDMAESNVRKANMSGLVNNFGAQYLKLIKDRNAVEEQRRLNEIEMQRLMGMPAYPPQLRCFAMVLRLTMIVYAIAAFSLIWAIGCLATATKAAPAAGKAPEIECTIFIVILVFNIATRLGYRKYFDNSYGIAPARQLSRTDRIISSRWWDLLMGSITAAGCAGMVILWKLCEKKLAAQRETEFTIHSLAQVAVANQPDLLDGSNLANAVISSAAAVHSVLTLPTAVAMNP